MKLLPSLSLNLFLLSTFIVFPAQSQSPDKSIDNPAKLGLEKLSTALSTLNFSTSFVVVKNNQAEPYHWLHGLGENNTELTILARLNGPRRDILQKGNVVSYIEPEFAPYSVYANNIRGPIPSIFSGDVNKINDNYHFVLVGKSRVLGRAAQLIRIVPKDGHRLGYWLWLDLKSNLLLKLAILSENGQMLEQIQFTHLEITDKLSVNLAQLQTSQLPDLITLGGSSTPETNEKIEQDIVTEETAHSETVINNEQQPHKLQGVQQTHEQAGDIEINWQVNWLPAGFKLVKTDQHPLNTTNRTMQFMLFSDGLVDVSVYVGLASKGQQPLGYANDGATVVLTKVFNHIEVSVVGKIPANTAVKIADSVTIQ